MERIETYATARAMLPADAKWSSSFGNPGDGGYTEYWRQPDGTRWIISNGPWHLIECEFDWHCQRVVESPARFPDHMGAAGVPGGDAA